MFRLDFVRGVNIINNTMYTLFNHYFTTMITLVSRSNYETPIFEHLCECDVISRDTMR